MSDHLTIENAKLFLEEAITPCENVLARNLVASMQENERLKLELEEANCKLAWLDLYETE